MTTPLPPLSDEDLSAALDGLAGPDVEARIQADPSAQERFDALQAARDAIGQEPSAPDTATFDALIARAIEVGTGPAADGPPSSPPVTSPDGVVTSLAPRRRTSAGTQRWLVAAAIVALVAIGLGLVYSGTRDNRTETSATMEQADSDTATAETTTNSASDAPSRFEDGASDGAAAEAPAHSNVEPDLDPTAQQPADLGQLGTFTDKGSLRTALRAGFPEDSSPAVGDRPTNASVDRCNEFIQTVLGGLSLAPEPDEVGYASVAGDQYLVYEFAVDGSETVGSKLITAAEPQSCDLLFTFVR